MFGENQGWILKTQPKDNYPKRIGMGIESLSAPNISLCARFNLQYLTIARCIEWLITVSFDLTIE